MGLRGRKRAAPVNVDDVDGSTQKNSEYEQLREKRIKENLERMEKLGIFDMSLKLKPTRTPAVRRTPQRLSPLQPTGPARRSSRLQNATPVSYSEVHLSNSLDDEHHLLREEGSKPEIYTEEHEKLLGSTDLSWTFFVDGYGKDGKRIYDPVKGKTCHQCRQKTLGHRTHCCKCQMVQGQFCGDCLYMRYGEHVLEANKNPNWICPVCRGICNCSLCRQAKGWAPTGALYRKIAGLGYKSVAHYLIQTHRATVSTENNSAPVSAKRSLPFSDTEGTMVMTTQTEVKPVKYDANESNLAPERNTEPLLKSVVEPLVQLKHDSENSGTNLVLSCDNVGNFSADNKSGNENAVLVGNSVTSQTEVKPVEYDGHEPNLAPESSTEPLQKSTVEPLILLKHDSEDSGNDVAISCDNVGNFSADNKSGNENSVLAGSTLTSSAPALSELNDGHKGESQLDHESDIGKVPSYEDKEEGFCVSDDKNCDVVPPEESSKSKMMKPCRAAAQVVDTIAGRLRQRRGKANVEA
ncbi:hypothetical protein P3S68_018433 [Capsicum galapagoense]